MTFEEFAARARDARGIVFFTGAGISTESGVPDFRSPGGIWTKYEPVYFDDFLSSHDARVRYWKMKGEALELYKNVEPNIGHASIKDFEERGQDGLHRIAGVSEEKMVELHGTDRKIICLGCSRDFDPEPIHERVALNPTPPVCDACGGWLKPATVCFGQPMPVEAKQLALRWGSTENIVGFHAVLTRNEKDYGGYISVRDGGTMIEYEDEDPEIRRDYEEAVRRSGISRDPLSLAGRWNFRARDSFWEA